MAKAGAKATIRFVSAYAADESQRAGLGIRFVSVLPQLTPATDLGAAAVAAYAQRAGTDLATFTENLGPALTPEHAGKAILDLIEAPAPGEGAEAYLLSVLGETGSHHDVNEGRRYLSDAMVLAAELNMRPLIAHCHAGLGCRMVCRRE